MKPFKKSFTKKADGFTERLDYLCEVYDGENSDADIEIYVEALNDTEKILDESKKEYYVALKKTAHGSTEIHKWALKWFGTPEKETT